MNPNVNLNQPMGGLIFHSNALPLGNLASYRVALNVWHDELVSLPSNQSLPSVDDVVEKFKAANTSTICPYLVNSVARCIRQIDEQLTVWLGRSFAKSVETWTKYFDQVVWRADDYTVDYLKTGHKLLRSDVISEEEKFAIACSYCIENSVEDLWTCVSKNVDKPGGVLEYTLPWSLSYWTGRMENHATGNNISNTFNEDDFIENMPLNRCSIEYFWPYLTSHAQFFLVFQTVSLKDAHCMEYVLSNLNETALQRILNQKGSDIVEALVVTPEFRSLAIPFWKHVAELFAVHQFFELVAGLMLSAGFFHSHRLCGDEVWLCQQIWACAPHHLKEYVLNLLSTDGSKIGNPRIGVGERYRDTSLLKMILSEASPEQKTHIWKDNWLTFCKQAKNSDLNELIEMCLRDSVERMNFKRENMMKLDNIDSYCMQLLDGFELTKLNDFLIFCSVDAATSAELKRSLLRSYFFERYAGCSNLYFRRIDDFVSFINESFPNPEQNASFKKEFINSKECLDRLVERLYDGEFDVIKKLVAAFLSDEQDVREWKEEFTHYCHYSLSTGSIRTFNAAQWQNFMMWCLGSDDKVTEFKRSLNVDEVFDVFLEKGDGSRREARQLHKIFYAFCNWCLGIEEVAAFNHKYVSANPNDDEIRYLLYGKRRRE